MTTMRISLNGIGLMVLLTASAAHAQPPTAPATSAPSDGQEEARTRFSRGLDLYKDGDYKLALIEFQRAYDISSDGPEGHKNYRVLYNIGQVNLQLNNYARSLSALEQYLAEGKDQIPGPRRTQVETDIAQLRTRTAHITIDCNADGAEVTIDDISVGLAPFSKPLLVDAGLHRVSATKLGRSPAAKSVTLAGGDESKVSLDLPEIAAERVIAVPIPERPADSPSHTGAIIGWATTGALAVGAGITGGLWLSSQSNLRALRDPQSNATQAELSSAGTKSRTLGILSDSLAGAAVISGVVSLYLTLRKDSHSSAPKTGAIHFGIGVGQAHLSGTF
jgi:Tetratricopeptide repeat/PEGA domain